MHCTPTLWHHIYTPPQIENKSTTPPTVEREFLSNRHSQSWIGGVTVVLCENKLCKYIIKTEGKVKLLLGLSLRPLKLLLNKCGDDMQTSTHWIHSKHKIKMCRNNVVVVENNVCHHLLVKKKKIQSMCASHKGQVYDHPPSWSDHPATTAFCNRWHETKLTKLVSSNDKTKLGACNRRHRGRAINETDDIECHKKGEKTLKLMCSWARSQQNIISPIQTPGYYLPT